MRALLLRSGKYRIKNMQCPNCGGEMNAGYSRCVNCGGRVFYESDKISDEDLSKFFTGIAWVVAIVAGIIILVPCLINNL